MTFFLHSTAVAPQQASNPQPLGSLFETLVGGGPVMIPLGLCSVVALGWILERALSMRGSALGNRALAEQLVAATRDGGPGTAREFARSRPSAITRIFAPMFERWDESRPALEKAVEDSGGREIRALVTSLRPLTVLAVTAPLLGLLGTIIGIIIAFRDIALSDAMGKPEALATGIAQALVTTASGLVIAIPCQAAYYWFRARIDRFARLVEETGERILAVRSGRSAQDTVSRPPLSNPSESAFANVGQPPLFAQGTP